MGRFIGRVQKGLGQRQLLNGEGLTYLGGQKLHRIHAIGKIGYARFLRARSESVMRKV